MMQILELIAFTNNMKKVVLTVFKNNQNSNFFRALNYKLDETSPIDDEEEYCYEILSKPNRKLLPLHSHDNHHTTNGSCCPGHH